MLGCSQELLATPKLRRCEKSTGCQPEVTNFNKRYVKLKWKVTCEEDQNFIFLKKSLKSEVGGLSILSGSSTTGRIQFIVVLCTSTNAYWEQSQNT